MAWQLEQVFAADRSLGRRTMPVERQGRHPDDALGREPRLPENLRWRPFLIFYGIAMLACGLAAGIVALVALTRRHERSWLIWLPLLAGIFVTFLLLGEFLAPH